MPTNTPIPNHASLDFLGSQEWNTLTKLNNAIPMLGTTGALLGAPPAATAPNFYPQGGSTAGTTTAGGILTISFPVTFPGGVLTIVTTNGDNVAFGNLHFDVVSSTVTGKIGRASCRERV